MSAHTDEVQRDFQLINRVLTSNLATCEDFEQLAHVVAIIHVRFAAVVQSAEN